MGFVQLFGLGAPLIDGTASYSSRGDYVMPCAEASDLPLVQPSESGLALSVSPQSQNGARQARQRASLASALARKDALSMTCSLLTRSSRCLDFVRYAMPGI